MFAVSNITLEEYGVNYNIGWAALCNEFHNERIITVWKKNLANRIADIAASQDTFLFRFYSATNRFARNVLSGNLP